MALFSAGQMWQWKWLQIFMVLEAIATVFLVATSYVPDEYWQSLEVAHKIAFGYGYLTWEWIVGLRSYSYPMFIAMVYKILEYAHLDTVYNLITVPRILQALIAIMAEFYFIAWYKEQTSTRGNWAVVTVTTSWFWLYTLSRTLSNNVELVFNTIALFLYPWADTLETKGRPSFLWLVGLASMVRPTAILVWIPFCADHILRSEKKLRVILTKYVPITLFMFALNTAVDSFAHGELVFTSWNFLYMNILQGLSNSYGTHPFYWYFAVGLPTVLGLQLVPFLLGCKTIIQGVSSSVEIMLLVAISWTVCIFSFVQHKEFRFLLPILPMMWFISAKWLGRWSRKANVSSIWIVAFGLFVGCVAPLGYFGQYHQRGTLDVMPMLAKSINENSADSSLLFLMPCHSTPLYSHLHVNATIRFLTCNPNLKATDGYIDEADLFHLNSETWLKKMYGSNASLPTYIIHFDNLIPKIQNFLSDHKYVMTGKFFHTHLPEGRVEGCLGRKLTNPKEELMVNSIVD